MYGQFHERSNCSSLEKLGLNSLSLILQQQIVVTVLYQAGRSENIYFWASPQCIPISSIFLRNNIEVIVDPLHRPSIHICYLPRDFVNFRFVCQSTVRINKRLKLRKNMLPSWKPQIACHTVVVKHMVSDKRSNTAAIAYSLISAFDYCIGQKKCVGTFIVIKLSFLLFQSTCTYIFKSKDCQKYLFWFRFSSSLLIIVVVAGKLLLLFIIIIIIITERCVRKCVGECLFTCACVSTRYFSNVCNKVNGSLSSFH